MTGAKALALVVALAAGCAVGFFARPYVHAFPMNEPAASAAATAPTPAISLESKAATGLPRGMSAPPVTAALTARVHPLLNAGTNVTLAADGFANGLQFAEVAHASRNLNVPFVVLKDKVVRRHESLARAIHEMQPRANATREANRAIAQARSDVGALSNHS